MTPTPPDLHAYVFGELSEAERQPVERYLASNPDAAAEVERLSLVTASLRRLPEEEPPRRIAFVSDKVFEPTWLQRLWNSTPKLAFASAAMLSLAILAHALLTAPPPAVSVAQADPREISRQVEAEVAKRLDAAVSKAITEVRAEAGGQSRKLVAVALQEAEKKFTLERAADRLALEARFDTLRKQVTRAFYIARNQTGANE
ncbi:MAG TPA: hypothetical protein VM120_06635 [Bryobacteraceae bacterium]|nr:hypothetical protein [Bryobacteraceae bacterium]